MDNLIEINNISFAYNEEEYVDDHSDKTQIVTTQVFTDVSLKIPYGITSCIGQNGTGKSTLMLLSAGVLLPDSGEIFLDGHNTVDIADEEKRADIVSVVYQNMEFDTDETVDNLLHYVYENGFHKDKSPALLNEIIEVMQLENILSRQTDVISKGEMQRVVIAFSLLYGTKIIMMDEPVFACEEYQKDRIFNYITKFAKKYNTSIIYSAHELELSQKYSDNIIIFYKDKNPVVGKTEDLFTESNIEQAYNAPFSMLKHKEAFYREGLNKDN